MVHPLNQFKLLLQNEDLGMTPIENIFINHYLPKAPGDFVKVYLLGLKFCFHGRGDMISNSSIAKTLDLLESDVYKAWNYWKTQGIVDIENAEEGDIISFLNIKEVMLNTSSSIPSSSPKESTEDIISSRKNKKVKEMHDLIEQMYGRPLSPMEMNQYNKWMTDYSFEPEVVVLMLEESFSRGRKEMAYLKQVALNWYDAGVTSLEDAEKFMEEYKRKREKQFKIMDFLGFKRQPSKKEEQLMQKWFAKYQMDLDIIFEACGRTAGISQPNFSYVDKILADWHSKGFTTLEQVKEEKPPTPKNNYSPKKSYKKNSSSKLDMDHNYDMDSLEKRLLKRTRGDIND